MVLSMGALVGLLTAMSVLGIGATAVGAYEDKRNMNYNADEAQKARDYNTQAVDIMQDFNSAEAERNRNWQEYISSTAHQREVADLKAAGLNPILSANSGAAMGSGATAVSSFGGSSAQSTYNQGSMQDALSSLANTFGGVSSAGMKMSLETQPQNTYQKVYRNGKLFRVVATEKSRGN